MSPTTQCTLRLLMSRPHRSPPIAPPGCLPIHYASPKTLLKPREHCPPTLSLPLPPSLTQPSPRTHKRTHTVQVVTTMSRYVPSYQQNVYYAPTAEVPSILRRPSFDASSHSGRSSRSSRRVSFADEFSPSHRRSSLPSRSYSFNSDSSSVANFRYSTPSPPLYNSFSRTASSRHRNTDRAIEEFRAADRKRTLRRQKRDEGDRRGADRKREEKRKEGEKRRERKEAAKRKDRKKTDDRKKTRKSTRDLVESDRRHSRHQSSVDMTHAEAARRGSLMYAGSRRRRAFI